VNEWGWGGLVNSEWVKDLERLSRSNQACCNNIQLAEWKDG
jgi:hypothetical protein